MTFSIGDKVQWTHVSRRGRTISMSRREGTVTAVDGDMLIVKRGKDGANATPTS